MPDPVGDDIARNRYFTIQAGRTAGVAMVVTGILVTQAVIEWPIELGYALILVGLAGAFLLPQALARKWRTPRQ